MVGIKTRRVLWGAEFAMHHCLVICDCVVEVEHTVCCVCVRAWVRACVCMCVSVQTVTLDISIWVIFVGQGHVIVQVHERKMLWPHLTSFAVSYVYKLQILVGHVFLYSTCTYRFQEVLKYCLSVWLIHQQHKAVCINMLWLQYPLKQ